MTKTPLQTTLETSKGVVTTSQPSSAPPMATSKGYTVTTKQFLPPTLATSKGVKCTKEIKHQQTMRRSVIPRVQRYEYNAPTKDYAAQHLAFKEKIDKMLHIYNKQGEKESPDTLLAGSMSETWEFQFPANLED